MSTDIDIFIMARGQRQCLQLWMLQSPVYEPFGDSNDAVFTKNVRETLANQ